MLYDLLNKKLVSLCHPSRSKTKPNYGLLSHVFPRFASATCTWICTVELWSIHEGLLDCLCLPWMPEWLDKFNFGFMILNWKPLYFSSFNDTKQEKNRKPIAGIYLHVQAINTFIVSGCLRVKRQKVVWVFFKHEFLSATALKWTFHVSLSTNV